MSLPDQFSETLSETAKRDANYLRGIGERRVAPTTDTIGGLKALAGPGLGCEPGRNFCVARQ